MAKHRGKWISHAIKKAAKNYECHISGDTISKGEHYLNIQVATDEVGFNTYGDTFSIQETFAVALSQLAHKSLDQILDLLPPFLDEKDKKIAELKAEIKRLKLRLNTTFGIGGIHLITKDTPVQSMYAQLALYKYVRDDLRVTELVAKDTVIRSQEKKITELKKELAQLREYLSENGCEGKARRDERIAELEHENQFLKEHIKILGGLR